MPVPTVVPGNNGVFQPTIVAGGWVVGTCRRKVGSAGIGKDAIAGVWADHNLKPWRVGPF